MSFAQPLPPLLFVVASVLVVACDHGPEYFRPEAVAVVPPVAVALVDASDPPGEIQGSDASVALPTSRVIHVAHAPFADHPDVFVALQGDLAHASHIPVVMFLHGWYGCVDVVAGRDDAPCREGGRPRYAMDVLGEFARSGVTAMLLVPQFAFDRASCDPGRWTGRGAVSDLVRDVLADDRVRARIGVHPLEDASPAVLFAHSGAYVAAARALDTGGFRFDEVHLLDALYRDQVPFDRWIDAHGARDAGTPWRFTVLYTDREGTGANSRALFERHVRASAPSCESSALVMPDASAYRCRLLVARVPVVHEDIPRVFVHTLLRTSPLFAPSGG